MQNKKLILLAVALILSAAAMAADSQLIIPQAGDSQMYVGQTAGDSQLGVLFSAINTPPTINLVNPVNGAPFTTGTGIDIAFNFTGSDADHDSLTYTLFINGSANATGINVSSFTVHFSQTGSYNWNVQVSDGSTYVNSTMWVFSIQAPGTLVQGGGGGGYRGPSGEELSVIRYWAQLSGDDTWNIDYDWMPIIMVYLNTGRKLTNIELKITKKDSPIVDANTPYAYVQFQETNFQDSDLTDIMIRFRILKSWFKDNGVSQDDVVLRRLVGTKWTELPTKYLSEDSRYYIFESTSPGFSYYSLSTKKPTEKKPAVTPNPVTGQVTNPPVEVRNQSVTPTAQPAKEFQIMWVVLTVIGIIIIMAIIIIFTMPKKRFKQINVKESLDMDKFLDNNIRR